MTILYKYVPFNTGLDIINKNSVLFSKPETFNDPFDMPYYPEEPVTEIGSSIKGRFRNIFMNFTWATKTGILSLTRTPTNALMWAHYADRHHGMVIGIDTKVAGFTDEQRCLVPAQYGSVVYVSKRVMDPFSSKRANGLKVGLTHEFPQEHFEKLQRLFLHKPIAWSYEEEVRVVKCLDGLQGETATTTSGTFSIIQKGGSSLHLYSLPKGAIREVYFGMRVDGAVAETTTNQIKAVDRSIAIFKSDGDFRMMSVAVHAFESLSI